ncbi:putative redox-active protein (C_GCAxxG_C_C) [uncultured Alphaproteobacteria bacterium]|jgi:hypothetical protein|uniref:Putative redox-active protein (C_GCAxxG_C_C) n=1 Tax=uncultured Alphaproteobacteria bacterium TaxID=91750 RepID=A0A212K388_9PROT|nr:putative redox-active protein (C_GCAxxG_C_C) [uncultured Alphaproteobacteria bacterium]
MADQGFRVLELSLQGFKCSQILAILALEARGETSPELVRAATGLLGGMESGRECGCLTGGCCVLGLYAGRGGPDEIADDRLPEMLESLSAWFDDTYGARYGGTTCAAITGGDFAAQQARCPEIVVETLRKLDRILAVNGYAPDGSRIDGAEDEA